MESEDTNRLAEFIDDGDSVKDRTGERSADPKEFSGDTGELSQGSLRRGSGQGSSSISSSADGSVRETPSIGEGKGEADYSGEFSEEVEESESNLRSTSSTYASDGNSNEIDSQGEKVDNLSSNGILNDDAATVEHSAEVESGDRILENEFDDTGGIVHDQTTADILSVSTQRDDVYTPFDEDEDNERTSLEIDELMCGHMDANTSEDMNGIPEPTARDEKEEPTEQTADSDKGNTGLVAMDTVERNEDQSKGKENLDSERKEESEQMNGKTDEISEDSERSATKLNGDAFEEEGEEGGTTRDTNDKVNMSPEANAKVDIEDEDEKVTEANLIERALLSEEVDLSEKLEILKELLVKEHTDLEDTHLRQYEEVNSLRRAFEISKEVLGACAEYVGGLNEKMSSLSKEMNNVKKTLGRKMRSEGLTDWLEESGGKSDPEKVAKEKQVLAKAAEAKAEIADAEVTLAEAIKMAADCRKEAADLEAEAMEAEKAAEEYRWAVEKAQKEAEIKRKEMEEIKRKEEEKARKKAEEERRRREEEHRRKAEMERIKGTPEEKEILRKQEELKRQEMERRDPANWPNFVYTDHEAEASEDETSEPDIICIVRAMPGCLQQYDLLCDRLSQLEHHIPLGENEELVSSIVQIKPTLDGVVFAKSDEPWAVALPHFASRNNPIKEPVIKILDHGTWKETPTHELSFGELSDQRFCECRVTGPITFVAILKVKTDAVQMGKKGGKYVSPLDSRITLAGRPGLFRVSTNFNVKVQPVELGLVTEVKLRFPQVCEGLLASSPIVHLGLKTRKFSKPMVATVPCPLSPSRPKRPGTAAVGRDDKPEQKMRPKSAMIIGFNSLKNEDEPEDKLILLTGGAATPWTARSRITHTQSKNKDVAVVELMEPAERFMVLRLKLDTSTTTAEDIATTIQKQINRRAVVCLLRQRLDDPSDVIMTCANTNRVDRAQRKLNDAGYEDGPGPSKDIIVHEGQKLWIKFRGNIRCTDKPVSELQFSFNSYLNSGLSFRVAEVDQYAQKSSNMYRGFAQIYTAGMVQKAVKTEDKTSTSSKKKELVKMEWVEGEKLLAELLINLPKPDPEPPQPIIKAPVHFKTDGIIDEQLLRQLSVDLGDEWKLLATQLNVKRARIQAILRDHVHGDNGEAIFDMLVTWLKKVPRSVDKVEILCNGLCGVGRTDLVEEIKDRERDWRQERVKMATEARLKRAFLRVAQNQEVTNNWRHLALTLGLPEDDIDYIEEEIAGCREQCHRALWQWRDSDPFASVPLLSRHLRKIRCKSAADDIEQLV